LTAGGARAFIGVKLEQTDKKTIFYRQYKPAGEIRQRGSGVIVYHREPIESARDIYHGESTERGHAETGSKAARKACLSVKCFNSESARKNHR